MPKPMNRFIASVLIGLALASTAFAQAVQQSGSVTPNTSVMWSGTGIIKGGNTALDSPLTSFGVTRNGADAICVNSDRSTAAGRNTLCFQASTTGAAKITLQNYGTAIAQDLQFVLNGTSLTLPSGGGTFLTGTGSFVAGHAACFNSTSGVIQDCGTSLAAGTQYGIPAYTTTSTLGSTSGATAGKVLVGQSAAAPDFKTLSGDVGSVSAAGALTLSKVNGIPFPSTFTANGVLSGQGTSQFLSIVSANIGYCLLSQGLNSPPLFAPCASGSGTAAGANTQVQFNNSSSLGASANFTYVDPALVLGVNATTTGQLQLASGTPGGNLVTIQNRSATAAYNFNLPATSGTSGQPMLSGGGGTSNMTFGTLGIAGGGTNCTSASGVCLDNITGFATTGYVNRTGAGTYTTSSTIPPGNGGTGIASGNSGGVLAFTGASTIASSNTLTANGVVLGGGAGAVPASTSAGSNGQIFLGVTSSSPIFGTMSGDATITNTGAVTIANSAVTTSKMASAAAYSLFGNFTGGSAAPQYSTIGALTQKASPASGDLVILQDQAASGQLKYATISSIASAGSVSSIAGNTGAFTLNAASGITNSTNDIILSQGSSSQFGAVKVDNVTILASSGVIGQKATTLTNSLASNVSLNNTSTFFDGPSVAQGTSGIWVAMGTVTLFETVAAGINCRLTDGTTIAASARTIANANAMSLSLSGIFSSPAANIKIQCQDSSATTGRMSANDSGSGKDSTISVYRIQ